MIRRLWDWIREPSLTHRRRSEPPVDWHVGYCIPAWALRSLASILVLIAGLTLSTHPLALGVVGVAALAVATIRRAAVGLLAVSLVSVVYLYSSDGAITPAVIIPIALAHAWTLILLQVADIPYRTRVQLRLLTAQLPLYLSIQAGTALVLLAAYGLNTAEWRTPWLGLGVVTALAALLWLAQGWYARHRK